MSLIESSAPGRFGLVGNPSDMYGGSVISCTIAERAICTIDTSVEALTISMGDETQTLASTDDLTLTGGALDLPKAVLIALDVDPAAVAPFALEAESEIPRQSGLAGSTALLTAITGSLLELTERSLHPYGIAEKVRAIEFGILNTLCGFQDAYMTVFGGLHYMDFRKKDVALNDEHGSPYATMESLSQIVGDVAIVIAFTGVPHHSGNTHASLYDRYRSGDTEAVAATAEFASYARDGKSALLAGDMDHLAQLMTKNQALIRKMQPQNPANEVLIDAAMSAGAMAAKLAGAGGGGSIAALTTESERIASALCAAGATTVLYPRVSPGLTVCRLT